MWIETPLSLKLQKVGVLVLYIDEVYLNLIFVSHHDTFSVHGDLIFL